MTVNPKRVANTVMPAIFKGCTREELAQLLDTKPTNVPYRLRAYSDQCGWSADNYCHTAFVAWVKTKVPTKGELVELRKLCGFLLETKAPNMELLDVVLTRLEQFYMEGENEKTKSNRHN